MKEYAIHFKFSKMQIKFRLEEKISSYYDEEYFTDMNYKNYTQDESKLQWGITSRQSEWTSSKSLQTINAGEGVEKREPPCTVGGNVNWYSHYGDSMEVP